MTNWAQLYRECNADAIALVESLTPEQLDARVPATPDWSLHQLAAHLAGTASDAVAGRMDGAPSLPRCGRQRRPSSRSWPATRGPR